LGLESLDTEPLAAASGIEVCRRRTDLFDNVVRSLAAPFSLRGIAVVGTGGYGRGEMTPGSDLDLLIVHTGRGGRDVVPVADALLYPLWDAGIPVSHAVRTIDECRRGAAEDLATLTSLLDARHLSGSKEAWAATRRAASVEARGDGDRFLSSLEEDRNARQKRHGHLGRSLEGDLKESVGGLRDVHAHRWLRALHGRRPVFGTPDFVYAALDALLLVRTALHRVTGSRSNRLSAEHHAAVSDVLGLPGSQRWEPRDELMRLVSAHARWVEFVGHREPDMWRSIDELVTACGLRLRHQDPIAFAETFGHGPALSWSPGLHDHVVRMLGRPELVPLISSLDAAGFLSRLVPEWADVSGRPQRDPYHRFPVDVHLMATAAEAARLLREPDEPFAVEAVRSVDDPGALLLGALLHDIGKVGTGSHVTTGVQIAGLVLYRMGAPASTRDEVLFLVGEHLLLSDTATRRNLEDEDLILHVAARVRDERRLAMLYLLTMADAVATGPSASTPWRMTLVRDLVSKVSHVLSRGSMDRRRSERLEEAEERVRRELSGLPPGDVSSFLEAVPTTYLLSIEPSEAREHARLIVPMPADNEARTRILPGRSPGTYLVAVAARDRLGLLSSVAAAMTITGLSILTAKVFTTETGVALDLFEVRGAFEHEVSDERWRRFERTLGSGLRGELDPGVEVETLRAHYRPPKGGTPVSVELHQDASDFFTLVEVGGPDRMGLLFDLTSALAGHRFDVHSAKVATYGSRVVDVFYVTEAGGQKVDQAEREAELAQALLGAVAGPSAR
jgi:[protein-PII] uridylyltransferase